MKHLILFLCIILSSSVTAQNYSSTESTEGLESIIMDFKYPQLIRVSTWEKSEISIEGEVSINNNQNNEAFTIETERQGDVLRLSSQIKNLDDLPEMIVINKGGNKYYFNSTNNDSDEIKAFYQKHGRNHNYQQRGVIKEITLNIKVPKSMALEINAVYGMVELKNISTQVEVNAKYGGIDLSLASSERTSITARTKFGEMFSDLNLNVDQEQSAGGENFKWQTIKADLNGGGTPFYIESKFGNIYIRKI